MNAKSLGYQYSETMKGCSGSISDFFPKNKEEFSLENMKEILESLENNNKIINLDNDFMNDVYEYFKENKVEHSVPALERFMEGYLDSIRADLIKNYLKEV